MTTEQWNQLQLRARQLRVLVKSVAEYCATDLENGDAIRESISRSSGIPIPILYCEGWVVLEDESCGLRRYHEGDCRTQA